MNKVIITTILLNFFLICAYAQKIETDLDERLYDDYETYKADFISHRRFKHGEIIAFVKELSKPLKVRKVGSSVNGKSINMISYGEGDKSVLLWSQMHGNEPTATMALMDIFNFFNSENDNFRNLKQTISNDLTVHFIPMLNPDGADKFVRRNDQGIDINRDALRQQTPEGRTLKRVRDSLNADWGFNLHDQGRTSYIVDKSATISVLAPAYDYKKSINEKRGNAMQLIALMNETLQKFIPEQVSQYSDDFEPRAFGDNIQKWGTRTILVESGGLVHDREKQEIRKLNFVALLMALYGIATDSYAAFTTEDYFQIPRTSRGFRDLIIKNVNLPNAWGGYFTDIAFNFQEIENEGRSSYYLRPSIVDIGDLSTSGAYLIHDVDGYEVKPGKVYEESLTDMEALGKLELSDLIKNGVTDFVLQEEPGVEKRRTLPLKILRKDAKSQSRLTLGSNPSLLFYKGNQLERILVNGYFFSPSDSWDRILDGMKKL